MGEIISIQEQIRLFEFRIGYTTGEERIVSMDPEKREFFLTQHQDEKDGESSLACPFLRQRGPRERICTVHASLPELCCNYFCACILILSPEGKKAGRVLPATLSFTTEDRTLLDLWCRTLHNARVPDDEEGEKTVVEVFTRAGYRIIR
jgi:hypothetical protein